MGIDARLHHLLSSALLFLIVLFTTPLSAASEGEAAISQVQTKISFLETLLNSSNAEKIKQYQGGRLYNEAQTLLRQSKQALERGDLKTADTLASRGFSTFTDAVKQLSRESQKRDRGRNYVEQYKERHQRVNRQYLQLNAISTKPSPQRQALLDQIAHHLSTAERHAGYNRYPRALQELDKAQQILAPFFPDSPPVTKTPTPANTATTPKKEVAPPTPPPSRPAKTAILPAKAKADKPTAKRRSPKELYFMELGRFQRYEARIAPALERDNISEEAGMKLLDIAQATREKADRAKGQAIDGNYTTALRMLKEATNELKAGLKALERASR